ncbi:MAG: hypothetical protein AAFQ82_10385 [Myxococcota bacterium]
MVRTRSIFAAAALLLVGVSDAVAQSDAEWSARLEADLNAYIVDSAECAGSMDVVDLERSRSGGRERFYAVVQLNWPPGLRRRPFYVTGQTAELTYQQLLNAVLYNYGDVWRGCIQ